MSTNHNVLEKHAHKNSTIVVFLKASAYFRLRKKIQNPNVSLVKYLSMEKIREKYFKL